MKTSRLVHGLALSAALAASGCGRPTPPAPSQHKAPEQSQPAAAEEPTPAEIEPPAPEPIEPEPVAPVPARPNIPDAPASGTLDGEPFVLAGATLDHSVLTMTDQNGRTVSIVVFRPAGDSADLSIDLVSGDIPFGSPHVVVRTEPGEPTRDYTGGYRLILELGNDGGRIWLELPENRGTVAGTINLR